MINRKIITSMLTIVMAFAVMTGGTMAYFTATADSANNTFTAGSMSIDIQQTGVDVQTHTRIAANNWQPGDSTVVRVDVHNGSTIPVNLAGVANGTWDISPVPSDTHVKVTKVEYYDGTAWQTMANNSAGITGPFYFSTNGLNSNLITVAPGTTQPFQITVTFDSDAGNEFESHIFTGTVSMIAKQLNATSFQ